MKTCEGVEIQFHAFLTLVLDGVSSQSYSFIIPPHVFHPKLHIFFLVSSVKV